MLGKHQLSHRKRKEVIIMKKILAIALTLILVISLAACASESLVGKWVFGGNTIEFTEDGKVSVNVNGTLNYDGTYEVEGDKIVMTVSTMLGEKTEEFTYTLKGKSLTLNGDITFMGGVAAEMPFEKQ